MRILALVTESFGGIGGIAQSNRDLLRAFSELGHETVVLPRKAEREAEDIPKKINFLAPRHNQLTYSAASLIAMANKGSFDLIFCGHIYMAPLAAFLSKIFGVPFWIHLYGIESWQKPSSFVKRSAEKSALVTAISRYTRRKFLAWAAIDPERVRLLPPVLEERFTSGPKPADLIKRYGLEGKKVILTVGRLSKSERYKGHDKIIHSLPQLIQNFPDLAYVIAGDGDDRTRLEALAEKQGVKERVRFIGKLEGSELPMIYRMADVFAMPSTGEGFGIVFLEAAASGIAVLGGNRDGSPDALQDGELGLMIDPENGEQLIEALKKLILERPNISNTGKKFSFLNFKRQLQRLLEENIHENPSHHS